MEWPRTKEALLKKVKLNGSQLLAFDTHVCTYKVLSIMISLGCIVGYHWRDQTFDKDDRATKQYFAAGYLYLTF